MAWVKNISIALLTIMLFAGGIVFYIFVIEKWRNKGVLNTSNLNINQLIELKKSIKPSTFQVQIEIVGSNKLNDMESLDSKAKEKILQDFNAVVGVLKEHSNICSGGIYSLGLKNFYYNNTKKRTYDAQNTIECRFTQNDNNAYNDLLTKISKIIESNEYLTLNIPPINPIITDTQYQQSTQELKYELVKKSEDIKKEYEKLLQTKCNIRNINFENVYPIYREAKMALAMDAAGVQNSSVELPLAKAQDISSRANISIECDS